MNRLEWLLSGLLGLLLIVVAVMAILFWGMRLGQGSAPLSGGSPLPAVEGVAHTAQSAYDVARAAAAEWADDAQLLSANSTWPAGTPFTPGAAGWGFQFYSAAQQSTALFAVSEEQVRLVRSGGSERAPEPLNVGGWLVDSPEVVQTVMANGGQEFIDNHGQASLTLTLNLVEEFQWRARLVDLETNEVVTIIVNPASGAASAPLLPEGEE